MSIGKNIKRLRESHGMNQADLALIAGVTDKAVSTWENDLKIPRMGAIQKIAEYFGIPKSNIIEDSIGDNIHALRLKKKVSLQTLAEQTNISPDILNRFEIGIAIPTPHMVKRIADALNVDKFEIIGWNEFELDPMEVQNSTTDDAVEHTDPKEDHLISNYRSLDDEKKTSLIDYSNYLKNQM